MRFAKLAAAAIVLGLFELALGWRLAILGATPDLLLVLAAFAVIGLRPGEGMPAACAIGLFADFLVGGRLGLMALGFGIAARAVEAVRPILRRWEAGGAWRPLAWAGGVFVLVLAGAAAAHGTVAALGCFLGGAGGVGARSARAVEIAFLTAAVSVPLWPLLVLTIGPLGRPIRARPESMGV